MDMRLINNWMKSMIYKKLVADKQDFNVLNNLSPSKRKIKVRAWTQRRRNLLKLT